jgi:hypothetical protein
MLLQGTGVVTESNVDKNRWLRYARNETPGIMGMFRDIERFTTMKGTKQKAIRRCFYSF